MLHDTLQQLGVMPKLQIAADGLPDARSRLNYIASKTGARGREGAELGRPGQGRAPADRRRDARAWPQAHRGRPGAAPWPRGAVMNFVGDVEARTARIDQHLTDIMMAQDFHDLTGQVVAKVVTLASDLEDSLRQAAGAGGAAGAARRRSTPRVLQGPVVDPEGRTDVVTNQGEVDDLLASLGF